MPRKEPAQVAYEAMIRCRKIQADPAEHPWEDQPEELRRDWRMVMSVAFMEMESINAELLEACRRIACTSIESMGAEAFAEWAKGMAADAISKRKERS